MARVNGQETINISKMTMKEKIGQMIIIRGDIYDENFLGLNVGGIFLDRQDNLNEYKELIREYQENSNIKLFAATDLEGYWNPFPFFYSKSFGEIENEEESYELGASHGEILKEMGFNLNFAPVVEVKNKVWVGRSFTGEEKEIKAKIGNYIRGLQNEGIKGTAKHYPGGNMLKDPHLFPVKSEVEKELQYFDIAIENNISAIMIGHAKVFGEIDSYGKQSTVSPEIVGKLRKDYEGLIITDEINMWGLKLSYLSGKKKLYGDLIKAGNDLILDFSIKPRELKRIIAYVEKEADKGDIKKERIDDSIERILVGKGYKVAR